MWDTLTYHTLFCEVIFTVANQLPVSSVVVKDLRLKDKDLMSKDEDKEFENWSSRILDDKDNNTAVRQYGEIDMNLNLTGWAQ